MSKNSSTTSGGGIGFVGLLAIVFITLKLTGVIAWSWWWVLAPLWIMAAIVAVGILVLILIAASDSPRARERRREARRRQWLRQYGGRR